MDKYYRASIKIGARQERLKDKKLTDNDIECEITINKEGFCVRHDNKMFKCYNGIQLISYLQSINISERQLLDLQELILKECMRRGMEFPEGIIDLD